MGSVLAFPIAAALAVICKKRWEDTVLPVTTAMIAVLLLSGMFTTFLPGVVFCILAALAATVFCIRTALRDRQALTTVLLSPGVLFFLLSFLFFLYVNLGGVIDGKADTWAHWALAVRNNRYFDDLVIGSPSTDRYATYPPALPIWNYLSTRLWFRYSEGMALLGQDMLYVTLLTPLFRTIPAGRYPRRFLILLLTAATLPYLARTDAYLSLYADTVLALAAGYCLIQYYLLFAERDRFYLWTAAAGQFLLSLTKETGMAIGGLIVFAVTCYALIRGRLKGMSAAGIRSAVFLIPWVGYVLAPMLWYSFLYLAPASGKAGNSLTARAAAEAIAARGGGVAASGNLNHVTQVLDPSRWVGRFEDWQYLTFKRSYLTGLFTGEFYTVNLFFRFTPFAFLILILLVPWVRQLCARRKEAADSELAERYRIGSELYYVIFGIIAFYDIIYMPVMYLVLFPWGEVQYLASFPRYLTPLTVMALYYSIFLFLKEAGERETSGNNRRASVVIPYLILLVFLLQSGALYTIASLAIDKPDRTMFWGLEHSEVTPAPEDVFLFVNDTDEEADQTLQFYYRVMPARSNRSVLRMQIKDGTDERTGKDIVHEMSPEEFETRLREDGANYLYLNHIDSEFATRYGDFFADGVPVGDGKLYAVDLSGERPVFTLLGE